MRMRSSKRRAAPVGRRRPFSQLMAVTFGTLSSPANTAWLTLSFWRNAVMSSGPRGSIGEGRESWLVRSVSFCLPCTCAARHYPIKQVAPVIKAEANEIVVITVYTFYF